MAIKPVGSKSDSRLTDLCNMLGWYRTREDKTLHSKDKKIIKVFVRQIYASLINAARTEMLMCNSAQYIYIISVFNFDRNAFQPHKNQI